MKFFHGPLLSAYILKYEYTLSLYSLTNSLKNMEFHIILRSSNDFCLMPLN